MANSLQNGPAGHHGNDDSAFARFARKFTESRSFMISLMVHAIVVILAGSIVILHVVAPVEDFASAPSVPGVENSPDPFDAAVEKPRDIPDISKVPHVDGAPQLNPASTIRSGNPSFTPFVPGIGKMHLGKFGSDAPGIPTSGSIPRIHGVPVGIHDTFIVRFGTKPHRDMKPAALSAVQRSLKWLGENQNPDGSWGDGNRSAMTGLALLCFLGFGELPDSDEYGYTINRASAWLIENGTKSEGRMSMEKTFTQSGVYEHGIATYALGEFYALTHDDRAKELLAQAVAHIVQGQGPGGGWMYGFDKTADDLSVSGWQIQALKAASLTGLHLPGVESALDKAANYVERVRGPKGGYGYRGPEDRYSLTGVGLLTQLFWKGNRGELSKGMSWLIEETGKNHPVKYRGASADLYAWYYHTQACLMFGGKAWEKWNRWFQDELCAAQSTDGSWPLPGAKGHGPQSDLGRTGAVYRTTLCTLMLEVFYRYSPVHRE